MKTHIIKWKLMLHFFTVHFNLTLFTPSCRSLFFCNCSITPQLEKQHHQMFISLISYMDGYRWIRNGSWWKCIFISFFICHILLTFWQMYVTLCLKNTRTLAVSLVSGQESWCINESKYSHWHQLTEINSVHLRECPFPQNKWGIKSSYRQGSPPL